MALNLFELVAKLTVDSSEYEKGLVTAEKNVNSFGNKMSVVAEKTATLSKVAAAGLTAIGGLAAVAVKSYADYEQLIGGVETLFKDSADEIKKYADVAFKTAGLSANDYMETVTSFSASLIQSLGGDTEKAAKIADQAIIDMSDNANKMGSSMESIQNAYQGFAKQNYTMLDNLKLGYGGTKEEMERLLEDAGRLANTKFDISSFADITEAIHVVQENMGIAGTTAKEAEATISGSINMMKASWSNLLTEFGKSDADIGGAMKNLTDSVSTVWDNLKPVIGALWENLPIWGKISVGILGVVAVISPIAAALSNIIGLVTTISTILPALTGILATVKGGILAVNAALLANPIVLVIAGIAALIAILVVAYNKCDEFREAVDEAFAKIKEVILNAVDKVKEAINWFVDLPEKAKEWGQDMIDNFVDGIKSKIQNVKDAVKNVANTVKDFLGFSEPDKGPLSNFHTYAPDMIDLFTKGMYDNIPKIERAADSIASSLAGDFSKTNLGEFDCVTSMSMAAATPMVNPDTTTNTQMQMLNSLLSAISQGKSDHTTIIQLDGKTIARAVDKPLQDISRQRGASLVGGGAW